MPRPRTERGFTLIEVLASLVVFSIVTLGIVPLILSSVRGTNLSRSFTVGKNLGVDAMERVRGLPFHISYNTQTTKVDLLDLYFPDANSTGAAANFNSGTGTFTTVCAAGSTNLACPRDVPAGYELVFRARFVIPTAPACPAPCPNPPSETYPSAPVSANYRWNPQPNTNQTDRPASNLLEMTITSRWAVRGTERNFTLRSLITNLPPGSGDKRFGAIQVRGRASLDYMIQVITTFESRGRAEESDLIGVAGTADSTIDARRVATAAASVRTARLSLVDPATGLDRQPPVVGASLQASAPQSAGQPDHVAGDLAVGRGLLRSPVFGDIAGISGTSALGVQGLTSGGLPSAQGRTLFRSDTNGDGILDDLELWITIPKAVSDPDLDFLNVPLLQVGKNPATSMRGGTSAATNAVGSGAVTAADASFDELRLFPVKQVNNNRFAGALIAIQNFQANVTCTATTNGTAVAPVATWSADLYYWKDDGTDRGYQRVRLSGSPTGGADPLIALKTTNPIVNNATLDRLDVHLFPVKHSHPNPDPNKQPIVHNHRGYLTDWSSLATTDAPAPLDGGRSTAAEISDAIRIDTEAVDPNVPESAMNISIGSLDCNAEDRR